MEFALSLSDGVSDVGPAVHMERRQIEQGQFESRGANISV